VQEAVPIYKNILDNCIDDEIRLMSIQGLALSYNTLGEKEKAKETAQRLPPFGINREKIYEIICDDFQEGLKLKAQLIMWQADALAFELTMLGYGNTLKEIDNNIQLIKKAISIFEIIFENGDYGFYNTRLGDCYAYLARNYMNLKEYDIALDCIEKSANYAIVCDTLPENFVYTSIAVKNYINLNEGVKNYNYNDTYRLLHNEFSTNIFDPVREHERFKAVIAELEKYAKKE
jgi:tetratricopeptide (TPR) repeat protein